jgi:hypothetical protein
MSSDSADEIRKRMELVRIQMRADVQALIRNARIKTDWRHYVERYPWLTMGAATLLGFWLVPKAARNFVLGPEMLAKLHSGQVPVSSPPKKSVLGLVSGTVVPLLTRMVVAKLTSHFLEREPTADAESESAQPSVSSRPYKPK